MNAPPLDFSGGEKLDAYLGTIASQVAAPMEVRVGFFENAKYPDGTSIAYIAAINEFGGSWQMPARETTVYRKVSAKTGEFLRGGRFVKQRESNFATTHHVAEYTHRQPPRPFFRRMIAANKAAWGPQAGELLKNSDYDVRLTLDRLGAEIEGQLQESIKTLTEPPLAPSTVRAKGFSKPLIGGARDSGGGGLMWQSTGHEVATDAI